MEGRIRVGLGLTHPPDMSHHSIGSPQGVKSPESLGPREELSKDENKA